MAPSDGIHGYFGKSPEHLDCLTRMCCGNMPVRDRIQFRCPDSNVNQARRSRRLRPCFTNGGKSLRNVEMVNHEDDFHGIESELTAIRRTKANIPSLIYLGRPDRILVSAYADAIKCVATSFNQVSFVVIIRGLHAVRVAFPRCVFSVQSVGLEISCWHTDLSARVEPQFPSLSK